MPLSAAADEKVAPGFETNAGSFRRGKNRKADPKDDPQAKGPKGSFRDFLNEKKGERPAYKPPEEPTAERKAKADRPHKTKGGFYRAQPVVERLRDRHMLDKNPRIAAAMCAAADKLFGHFYDSGLGGIAAQDLTREVHGSAPGTSSAHFPRTEVAMHNRQMFRQACEVMGWHTAYPHRGAGRIVVEVCCIGLGVEDAAKIHVCKGRHETVLASGLDRLREGLFALARHWKYL